MFLTSTYKRKPTTKRKKKPPFKKGTTSKKRTSPRDVLTRSKTASESNATLCYPLDGTTNDTCRGGAASKPLMVFFFGQIQAFLDVDRRRQT